jgi:DnaJ like chaperone protein
MSWMGKILGGGLGFVFGGPIGAVLGAALGHQAFDSKGGGGILSGLENKQSIYFAATFSMLGKLAKADGAVTQREVDVIDRIMRDNLRLPEDARSLAVNIFNVAKDSEDDFDDFAHQFYNEFGRAEVVLVSIIDLLFVVAYADGVLHPAEEAMIRSAVRIFGLDAKYAQIKGRFTGQGSGQIDDINQCYLILGCEPEDETKAIKRKYRKLAMEYHPDRVQANGMTPELVATAEAKFKDIQHAWDVIEKERKKPI